MAITTDTSQFATPDLPPIRSLTPAPAPRSPRNLTLSSISREMRAAEPVFIVGEARSGSTLLLYTLLKHPRFAPREENLQESSFIVQAPAAARFADDPPRNLRRFLLEDEDAWADFLTSIRLLRPWLRAAELGGRTVEQQWRLGPATLVARSYAYHAWRARGCDRLLEKTPDHVLHIDRIRSAFPHARLLYVHRHPVDVYTSYVRRGKVDPKAAWARISPDDFCVRHRERTERALAAVARSPQHLLLVRYEQLTTRPVAELRRICRFLGEACDPARMLEPDPDPHRVAHWEGSGRLFRGMSAATKPWTDYASRQDAAYIEGRLADLMDQLRYDRYT